MPIDLLWFLKVTKQSVLESMKMSIELWNLQQKHYLLDKTTIKQECHLIASLNNSFYIVKGPSHGSPYVVTKSWAPVSPLLRPCDAAFDWHTSVEWRVMSSYKIFGTMHSVLCFVSTCAFVLEGDLYIYCPQFRSRLSWYLILRNLLPGLQNLSEKVAAAWNAKGIRRNMDGMSP